MNPSNLSVSDNKKLRKIFGSSLQRNRRGGFVLKSTSSKQQRIEVTIAIAAMLVTVLFFIFGFFLPANVILSSAYYIIPSICGITSISFMVKAMSETSVKPLSIKKFLKDMSPTFSVKTKQLNDSIILVTLVKECFQEPTLQLMKSYITNFEQPKEYSKIVKQQEFKLEEEQQMWEYISSLKLEAEELEQEASTQLFNQVTRVYQKLEKDHQTKLLLEVTKK